MKSICVVGVAVLLLAVNTAQSASFGKNMSKPSQRMSSMEQMPSMEDISIEEKEKMSMEKAAETVEKIYHMAKMNPNLRANFVPSASSIPCYMYKPNGQKVSTSLDRLAMTSKQQPNFGDEQVTIFITGYPSSIEATKKANQKMVEAFMQRNNNKRQQSQKSGNSVERVEKTSSEEDSKEWQKREHSSGNLVVIDLGYTLNDLKRIALMDTEQTGAMIASALMEMMEQNDMPDEVMHIVAQGIAVHVAGAADSEFSRRTGRHWKRMIALDPSKMFAENPRTSAGLSRSDVGFVDAIHTNVFGMGTKHRVGDVDFYFNGHSAAAPGAKNIVESRMRPTRYFAESVHTGKERKFPAEGTFEMFLHNPSFGKVTPVRKQNNFHGTHKSRKHSSDEE